MSTPQLTLADAIDGYSLAAEITLSPITCQNYTGTFRCFQAFFEDDPILGDLTPRDIECFLASQNNVTDATIRTRQFISPPSGPGWLHKVTRPNTSSRQSKPPNPKP